MNVDAVAEAIRRADLTVHSADEPYADVYLRMAQAAVDAIEAHKQDQRLCSYCDGTGIVPGSEGQTWVKGIGWTVVQP